MQDLTLSTSYYRNTPLAIDGIQIKCVASNIRRLDIPWQSYKVVHGRGYEGNIVVVEVINSKGYRTFIEDQYGTDRQLYAGDKFIAVLANRYSGTSESGFIPDEGIMVDENLTLQLLSAGGVVGINSGTPYGAKEPLNLKCIGLISDESGLINIDFTDKKSSNSLNQSAPVILVCGTSAEVGKTTTASKLISSLVHQDYRVAGAKLTGTGRMRDIHTMRDAGATPAIDFPEFGLATTYTSSERFLKNITSLLNFVSDSHPDVLVAEAGGDVIEANVPTLLNQEAVMKYVKAIVIVSGDVMGMMGTISYIRSINTKIPIYLVDPKNRNPVTTRDRVIHELPGFVIFNSLNEKEVKTITKKIMEEI